MPYNIMKPMDVIVMDIGHYCPGRFIIWGKLVNEAGMPKDLTFS